MKTFETEKNNIPEGSTHYSEEDKRHLFTWFKVGDTVEFYNNSTNKWQLVGAHISCLKSKITPIPKSETTEWKNGDELDWLDCDNKWCSSEHLFVGEKSNGHPVIEHKATGNVFETYWGTIRKPESTEEKEKRERLEAAYDLYCVGQSANNELAMTFDDFCSDERNITRNYHLAIVDKTNYRKGE